jgi:hypothetical protein
MLGYDVKEVDRSYEISGVTGNVTKYMTQKMEFPCIVLNLVERIPSKPKLELLQTLFQNISVGDLTGNPITVSGLVRLDKNVEDSLKFQKLGKIQPKQVKSLLKMFSDYELFAYTDKNTMLSGNLVYALAE